MGLFSSVIDVVSMPFRPAYEAFEFVTGIDYIEQTKATVNAAVSGDPVAIAALAGAAYTGYSIYATMAASSAAATTVASTTASTTATTTASTAAASGTSASLTTLSNEAFAEAAIQAAQQGTAETITSEVVSKAAEESLKQTLTEVTLSTGTDIAEETLTDQLLNATASLAKSSATTAATTAIASFLTPDVELPEYEPLAPSELFDVSPDIETGASSQGSTRGFADKSSNTFTNINVLGSLG